MLHNTNFLTGCPLNGFGIASASARSAIGNTAYIERAHHVI